jgi:hypothetical protein
VWDGESGDSEHEDEHGEEEEEEEESGWHTGLEATTRSAAAAGKGRGIYSLGAVASGGASGA